MPRININLSEALNERLRAYSQSKGITMTSIIEHALLAYFNDLELKSRFETLFTDFFKETTTKRVKSD